MTSSSKNDDKSPWWQPSLVLFVRLSGWIGGPVIIALFAGQWLDEKFGTKPWLFLGLVGLAFVASSIGIAKEATEAMRGIQDGEKDDPDPDQESDRK